MRSIDANFGILITLLLNCGKELPPLWDEETGLCVGWSGVSFHRFIVIRIFLLKHLQEALTGEHINPASLGIVEQVIARACNLACGDFLAGLRIKDN